MLKFLRNLILASERAFTLIEMMIVLMIISILLLIAVPNMMKSNKVVGDKSCDATVKMIQSQVAAYQMDHEGQIPTLQALKDEDYVNNIQCPNGNEVTIDATTGEVSASE
ncbi:prepilin-type N-terminal cleavage/methylation domain-containing protein [Sporolactobacillus sp. THM7-7]|nr:prepilin-type N-terminal cleavage/methylation domain-containing protein [Sporolactobacillus sp. THM7-7]